MRRIIGYIDSSSGDGGAYGGRLNLHYCVYICYSLSFCTLTDMLNIVWYVQILHQAHIFINYGLRCFDVVIIACIDGDACFKLLTSADTTSDAHSIRSPISVIKLLIVDLVWVKFLVNLESKLASWYFSSRASCMLCSASFDL